MTPHDQQTKCLIGTLRQLSYRKTETAEEELWVARHQFTSTGSLDETQFPDKSEKEMAEQMEVNHNQTHLICFVFLLV